MCCLHAQSEPWAAAGLCRKQRCGYSRTRTILANPAPLSVHRKVREGLNLSNEAVKLVCSVSLLLLALPFFPPLSLFLHVFLISERFFFFCSFRSSASLCWQAVPLTSKQRHRGKKVACKHIRGVSCVCVLSAMLAWLHIRIIREHKLVEGDVIEM